MRWLIPDMTNEAQARAFVEAARKFWAERRAATEKDTQEALSRSEGQK